MQTKRNSQPEHSTVAEMVDKYIDQLDQDLWELNRYIHDHPEFAFGEHKAHDRISDFLEGRKRIVQRQIGGLETAFESRSGSGGRCANFSAEYDALPGIGHACGHNLIATAAIASYLALSHVLEHFGFPGRAHLLGTPAEEDGGGKILLLQQGAYGEVDVSLMIHPVGESLSEAEGFVGFAGQKSNANVDLVAEFRGKSAHAAAAPWEGINALDAVVAAYNNTSILRQHMKPDERLHSCILQAPKVTNAIPEYTKVRYSIRGPSVEDLEHLEVKVRNCIEAAGMATGCEVAITTDLAYAEIQVNRPLCERFTREMDQYGLKILPTTDVRLTGSTDMGNVSQVLPGLHAMVCIPAAGRASPHTHEFAAVAGSRGAHLRILEAAKALVLTAWAVLTDDEFYGQVRNDFCAALQRS